MFPNVTQYLLARKYTFYIMGAINRSYRTEKGSIIER